MTSIEFIYVFHTHCAGGMHTEFMVTGCLWGARVGKRTEKVKKKKKGGRGEGFSWKCLSQSLYLFGFLKKLFKNNEFRGRSKLESFEKSTSEQYFKQTILHSESNKQKKPTNPALIFSIMKSPALVGKIFFLVDGNYITLGLLEKEVSKHWLHILQ